MDFFYARIKKKNNKHKLNINNISIAQFLKLKGQIKAK